MKHKSPRRGTSQSHGKKASDERQAAVLAAMKANSGSPKGKDESPAMSVVVKRGKSSDETQSTKPQKAKPIKKDSKAETAQEREARLARELEEKKLKELDARNRKKAAEEAQKRTLEAMKAMASRYSDTTEEAVIVRKDKDEPLADGLVGAALEESFEKERREIKRGSVSGAGKAKRCAS